MRRAGRTAYQAYCREDDAPAPARAHRGTTSLAAPARCPRGGLRV